MRRFLLLVLLVGSLPVYSCASSPDAEGDLAGEPTELADDAIINGTQDNAHTAVVTVVAQQGLCTGTVVKLSGSTGFVLTAAHCCTAQDPPQQVWTGVDYNNPTNAYNVVPGSVTPDPLYNGQTHDFCMLKFSGAPPNMPVIPAMMPAEDNLQVGTSVEFVGYGIAGTPQNHNVNNSIRNHLTGSLSKVNALTVEYNQQGNNGGPCNGDSGGPALTPPNVAQSTQRVAAVTSYGDANCAVYGVSGRVSAVYNTFIDPYFNGQVQPPPADCNSCSGEATGQGGACSAASQACFNDQQCSNLVQCLNGCNGNQNCINNCANQYPNGINKYNAVIDCICTTGCVSECATECGGTPSDCGLSSSDPTCNTCLEGSCCNEAQACANNQTCVNCLVQNPPASCNNNAQFVSFFSCLDNKCAVECGSSSSSSSSSSSGASSSSSGGSSSSSSGAGGGGGSNSSSSGAGGSAGVGGAGGAGGDDDETSGSGSNGRHSNDSGCACDIAGGADDGQDGRILAGLGLATALMASRRRRPAVRR